MRLANPVFTPLCLGVVDAPHHTACRTPHASFARLTFHEKLQINGVTRICKPPCRPIKRFAGSAKTVSNSGVVNF
ncbi:hypothetical protein K443DRAFT_670900 [Laccaria amethystina LaAM-08-1]|uniref:Uncharacterized protein n=1 Tax=Laccaria amethystina LaAM-08-1 TaxID=1095629 RepID=A0A0C9YQD4_9AGAR|nr:hypothetical protein K443DRAFT_670900 [Laccaria amethystina LaAM-08-1]